MVGPAGFEILCNLRILDFDVLSEFDGLNGFPAIFAQSLHEIFHFAGICLSFCSGMTFTG